VTVIKKGPVKVVGPGSAPKKIDALKDVRDYYAKNGHVPTELANESRRLYGAAGDSKMYADLGIKIARGQLSKAQALASIRNGAGVDDLHRRAGDAVRVELDPAISQLDRRAKAEQDLADQQIAQGQRDTDAYAQSVAALYSKLGGQLEQGNQRVQQGYQAAQQQTGKSYDDLMASLSQTYGGAIQDTTSEAQRLGLDQAIPQATAQMSTDQKFLSGLFGGQKASAVDMLVANGLIDLQQGARQGGAVQAAGAQYQTQAREENLRNATELRNTAARNVTEYHGQAGDLEATRGAKLRENISALEDARTQAKTEAEAREFDRQILLAKLELQRQELGTDAAYKAGQLEIGRTNAATSQQRVALEAKKTEATLRKEMAALTPGTLEYEEKLAAINLKKSQTKKNIADYSKPPAPTNYPKGRVGAEQYLRSLGDESLVKAGMHEVTLAMQYGEDYPSAIQFMRKNFSKFSDLKDPNVQKALLNALDLAWTGSKNPGKK
jgi:hypothetical protein